MGKFRVWVEQVNQTMYEVEASSPHAAMTKVWRIWKREEQPRISYMENSKGERVNPWDDKRGEGE